mmetsp:Transcript_60836/g.144979  ORF Transcript_60836/g.144979 Transcript_60836/m.144979 type:complete len:280 (-) Transcript_60836:71-910(-)|eukprot:CAMPEP_0178451986 /NCGR_PEP_ID=MMETSP0689_2-20121128/43987_1 /TAXON_ID=160604 /ORGANISM="Amphidinium massartii, Strain CS-259" /LENGTH=279 /DNA_ID=CAMNT_0020077629 /DNA_START=53 /DNA_END=892 /DNA_ORIENTATION=+
MSDENKIYVGGLSYDTTNDSLQSHFEQFGEVEDCIVMVDKGTGKSRGFGFVTFKDASGMNAALGTSNNVDGREVSCKKAVRENHGAIVQGSEGTFNSVKLFVGGLPASCDYDKFTEYFGKYGAIEDAVVMMDNNTGRHRGFGYVTFAESSAVEAALENYSGNQIDGKWIEVKRCIPQDKMGGGGKGKGKSSAPKGYMGGGHEAAYGAYGGYGSQMAGYGAYGAYPYGGYAQAYGAYGYNPAAYSAYMAAYSQPGSMAAAYGGSYPPTSGSKTSTRSSPY